MVLAELESCRAYHNACLPTRDTCYACMDDELFSLVSCLDYVGSLFVRGLMKLKRMTMGGWVDM